jgi:hypothetical protein
MIRLNIPLQSYRPKAITKRYTRTTSVLPIRSIKVLDILYNRKDINRDIPIPVPANVAIFNPKK